MLILQNNGKNISWDHLSSLYENHCLNSELSIVKKLRYEHIHMTGFSKMRIDLVAQVWVYSTEPSLNCIDYSFQVLSESVYTAMLLDNDPETVETRQFVCMFDRFFDCLNVCNFTNGKLNRKIFQQPYRSSSDFRLKVLNMHSKCTFFLLSTNIILSFLL